MALKIAFVLGLAGFFTWKILRAKGVKPVALLRDFRKELDQ